MRSRSYVLMMTLLLFVTTPATANSGFAMRIGPAAMGNGGSNPITGSILDFQLQYITAGLTEYSIGIPNISVGKRHKFANGAYVGAGLGIVIGANGGGFGAYTSFGGDFFCSSSNWCFTPEYTQSISFSDPMVNPYALRMGVSRWF